MRELGGEISDLAAALRARLEVERALGIEEAVVPGGLPAPPAPRPPAPRPPTASAPAPRSPAPGGPTSAAPARPPNTAPRAPARAGPRPAPARPSAAPPPSAAPSSAAAAVPADAPGRAAALEALGADLAGCTRCGLARGRKSVVFGAGSPAARLVFVGEGPGAEEDRQGIPFVGPAGQLLTKIIQAMGMQREDVYIANVVKCRPPGNRTPTFDEVETCSPFLRQQIQLIRPEVIVALGATAARMLLGRNGTMASFRGRWHAFEGTPLLATYHPAYLLRQPSEKRKVWEDMKQVLRRLGLPAPG